MNNMEEIIKQMNEIKKWLDENAPEVSIDQKHLDEGTEARKYWIYGRYIALRDVVESEVQ